MDQRDHRAFETAAILVAVLCLGACGADRESTPGDADTTAAKPAADTPALPRTPSPDGARVYFITPADGDTVTNPVSIEFGLDGMAVVPAGVDEPNSGHHHLIIDAGMPDLSLPIPANDNYVHFGDGSTKTERTLSPGTHTLQLLLGDHLHIPHDPPVASGVITVTVE
ncbi:MAG: DUF4399 domain-containing protein [Woeseiaceae bacterium]|nr:DUF4399 domain-containing protein [Woeseiaceae bacterium]